MNAEVVALTKALAARNWRLWEWVNGYLDRRLSERRVYEPASLSALWKEALERRLVDGDHVVLSSSGGMERGWFVSEWVPKAPGQAWQEDPWFDLSPDEIALGFDTPLRDYYGLPEKIKSVFMDLNYWAYSHWEQQYRRDEEGLVSLVRQGFGSRLGCYRPALMTTNEDRYALLSICSGKEYMVDLAFPVIVSAQVYRKFLVARKDENAVEIEARMVIREIKHSAMFASYMSSVGAPHNNLFQQLIESPLGTPSVVGHIISPLDVSVRTNGTHPDMTLRVDGYNVHARTKDSIPLISRSNIANPMDSFLYRGTTQAEWDKHRYGLRFLLGEDHQFSSTMNPATDFDARTRLYACDYPVKDNPADPPGKL